MKITLCCLRPIMLLLAISILLFLVFFPSSSFDNLVLGMMGVTLSLTMALADKLDPIIKRTLLRLIGRTNG